MGWSEKYKKSINCDNPKGFSQRAHCQGRKKKMNEAKEKDHEVSMAKTQVKKSIDNLQKVARVLAKKTDADNLPAWVQAKLTDTEHNTDAAASYMTDKEDLDEGKKKCGEGKYWCKTDEKCKKIPSGHHVMPNGDLMKDSEHEEGGDISEGKRDGKSAKDKGYSLRDWFKGGGWVQAGGKYDGKPCAKQPGQKTKPFCRDADDRANMSKKERNRRAAKKRREDPNPNRKGKAKIVTSEAVDATPYGGPINLLKRLVPKGDKVIPLTPKKSANLDKAHFELEGEVVSEKKDACYHKVKSRYSVWPSAYASGALVKCRKVGAKNWGNKTKKESYEYSNWRDDFVPTDYETVDLITADPIQVPDSNIQKIEEAKKCWKGYEKKGTQKLFGKTYNRCVKKEELSNWRAELNLQEDWQKVNKKDKTDGMSQKAVDAYKRENPGSKLKTAVTEKKPKGKRAKRRKSFCARSDGQRKMHNIDCKKTPDKAICKARRRWKC